MLIKVQIESSCITHEALKGFEGQTVLCEIRKYYPKRSNKANRFLWGAVYNQLKEVCSELTGYTVEEMHEEFKQMFLSYTFVSKLTGEEKPAVKSTASLNSKEFAEYVNKVIDFCQEKFSITLNL